MNITELRDTEEEKMVESILGRTINRIIQPNSICLKKGEFCTTLWGEARS